MQEKFEEEARQLYEQNRERVEYLAKSGSALEKIVFGKFLQELRVRV